MALTSIQIIQVRCSDLAADPNLSIYIDLAQQQTYRCFFGVNYNLAVALRACHMYALDKRSNGASGSISTMKEGDLSISYNTGTLSGDLSQTSYGRELQNLIKSSGPGISVLGSENLTVIC